MFLVTAIKRVPCVQRQAACRFKSCSVKTPRRPGLQSPAPAFLTPVTKHDRDTRGRVLETTPLLLTCFRRRPPAFFFCLCFVLPWSTNNVRNDARLHRSNSLSRTELLAGKRVFGNSSALARSLFSESHVASFTDRFE